ncbi:MAG: carboxypeptidase regulatory-like domain-containing protein [Flavobacteriales bacterium]|nr:carboxypeptidase regulatory-like domain-containing protein [Flavobacteriales bacterium]
MRSPLFHTALIMGLALAACHAMAQQGEKGKLLLSVSGRVLNGDDRLAGCEVVVFKGNQVMSTSTSDKNGRFSTALDLDTLCAIEFRATGFLSKRILVDTRAKVPAIVLAETPLVMNVRMQDAGKYEGVDTDVLDYPYALVKFDKKQNAFVEDPAYTSGMQRATGALLLSAARASKADTR